MDSHPCTDPGPHGTNSRMLSPRDNHEPTHDIPRNEQPHTPHTGGGFHPSLCSIPILFSFISESWWQGLLYIQKVQIQKPTSKDNPHLFPLHHSRIEPTPSQHIDFIFWSIKSPELPSYKQNSISRYYHAYTKNSLEIICLTSSLAKACLIAARAQLPPESSHFFLRRQLLSTITCYIKNEHYQYTYISLESIPTPSYTLLTPIGDGHWSPCLVTTRADEYKSPTYVNMHTPRASTYIK